MMQLVAMFRVDPVGAPRMTKRDQWGARSRRPVVKRYFAYRDELRRQVAEDGVVLPEHYHVMFHVRMPDSWPKKRREALRGTPHRQKPDKDNLEKAFLDALYRNEGNDKEVWDGRVTKVWADEGAIELYEIDPPDAILGIICGEGEEP